MALLWRAFQSVDDGIFSATVDRLIFAARAAPKGPEIEKMLKECTMEASQNRSMGGRGIPQIMQDAAKNSPADPDFVKACTKHLRDKMEGRITPAQFQEGCQALETMSKQLAPKAASGAPRPANWKRSPVGEEID